MYAEAQNRADDASFAEGGDRVGPATTRPVIYGTNAVVSSGHWLTSHAAMQMLLNGGNAFDAIAAAIFAAAVVEPTASFSLGAECVFMLREASGEVRGLCGQGPAALAATPEYFAGKGLRAIATGPGESAPATFTTPGVVGATLRLLADYGKLPLPTILAPAIGYARNGIVCYEYMHSRLSDAGMKQLQLFNTSGASLFYPQGKPAPTGSLIVQSALSDVLQQLSDAADLPDRQAGLRAARDLFYTGALAQKIASASQALHGILAFADLEAYVEEYEQPVEVSYRGYKIQCQDFWSQAPIVLQALNILEHFDLRKLGFNTPQYIHVITEALKLAFADREAYYADPKFCDLPHRDLLGKNYARQRAGLINLSHAYPEMPVPGRLQGATVGEQPQPVLIESTGPEYGTTHISVVDNQGNMVAATPSGGAFGKSVFLDELGFTLSTRSEMLNLDSGHPNCVAPGKRPRSTLCAYAASAPSGEIYTFGCPGGDAQAQGSLQIILNTIIWGMDPQQAVEVPRFATNSVPNSFYPHNYFPGRLSLEDGISQTTADALEKLGHEVVRTATCGMGAIVTRLDPKSGVRATGSDPRRSCHAVGW
jgi:gamma-glutamyltranspeptidase/glutathione hydrolase